MIRVPPRGRAFRPAVEELAPRLTPSVTFAGQQTFAVGDNPASVAAADFNGDGRADLVVANSSGNSVSVLLNATAPEASAFTFAAQKTFATGSSPFAVAVADFNGDGKPDIAVADFGDNTVSVLLNTTPAGAATPSFAAQKTFGVGGGPQSLAVADFNGDGKPDLVVADLTTNNVTVLLNTTAAGAAAPSFATPQTFAVGSNPIFVAVGDFNGDNKPDLAVTNFAGGTVSVLLNTTATGAVSATFSAQQTFAVGASPIPVAVGDFNGDGKADLAVGNSAGGTVSVLLDTAAAGATTPSFAAQQTFAVGGNPQGLAAADFDGDGKIDLAVGNFNDKTVSVLANTTATGSATVSFAAQQTYAVGTHPVPVALGDLNGDGQVDLAVANNADKTVSVLQNTSVALPPAPVVVGQFGGAGVWQYSRTLGTWIQLTAANASHLAADSKGDVVGDFPGYGVWLYTTTSGWKQINGVDASVLAINASGDIAAEFPGFGVGLFLPASGWRLLTPANAALLAIDSAGDVAAEFQGYGVYKYTTAAGWKQINVTDVTLLAMTPQGDVVAEFRGYGVWEMHPNSGWVQLNGIDVTALATNANGDVLVTFPGIGVAELFAAGGGRILTAASASRLGGGAHGEVFGDFPGSGVSAFDPLWGGWYVITPSDASLLVVA